MKALENTSKNHDSKKPKTNTIILCDDNSCVLANRLVHQGESLQQQQSGTKVSTTALTTTLTAIVLLNDDGVELSGLSENVVIKKYCPLGGPRYKCVQSVCTAIIPTSKGIIILR